MDIQEIFKLGWYSEEGPKALANLVERVLLAAKEPIGTTTLIKRLLPGAGPVEFKKLTSLLWTIRQHSDTKTFWAYNGKKTMYGKQAIHWLPLKQPRTAVKEPWETVLQSAEDLENEALETQRKEQEWNEHLERESAKFTAMKGKLP